jgi:hypothetical protein
MFLDEQGAYVGKQDFASEAAVAITLSGRPFLVGIGARREERRWFRLR